jgi:small nuclear ribonucleoprotein (snRNP)-like protein
LVALLLALQGKKLTVELRNDVMVTGTLAEVDEYMNMYIDTAVWTPVAGPAQVRHASC